MKYYKAFQTSLALAVIGLLVSACGENALPPTLTSSSSPANTTMPSISPGVTKTVIFSDALNKNMRVNIYLPPDYQTTEKYPVLYMLHGRTDDENSWIPKMNMNKKADQLIADKKIKPLIIVVPQIDNSFGMNSANTTQMLEPNDPKNTHYEGRYEDYLTKDLVTYMDSNYSTIKERSGRFIGGLSMGGFAALHLAFRHPELYSKVGGHSPALFEGDEQPYIYPDTILRKERDPLQLAANRDLSSLQVYLDCGDNDYFHFEVVAKKLHELLLSRKVNSEYHHSPGGHDYPYWSGQIDNYLQFYAGVDL